MPLEPSNLYKRAEIKCRSAAWWTIVRGFVYVAAIMDWYSRKVLAWRVPSTMDADVCVDVLEEAISRYGAPDVFNTDQGAQFTSDAFTGVLKAAGILTSIDGKGRWVDNVFVERLWRRLKYEDVYLKTYDSVAEARLSIGNYFRFYNHERRHQNLGRQTPVQVYEGRVVWPGAA